MQRILVLGATGLLGEPVARHLLDAGYRVRVMSRRAARARERFPAPFEVVAGDAQVTADLEQALEACEGVHISIDHDREDECVARVVEAAGARGVERISYISGTTAREENRWFPLVDRKLRAEEAIRGSGIGFTIFCPGWFMEMLARFVRDGRAVVFGKPRQRWHFVAVRDLARMVVESYRRPEAVDQRFYVHGPEALTVFDAVNAYRRALHPQIASVRSLPYWLARAIARLTGNTRMRDGVEMVAYLERVGESGDASPANAILGAPTITLAQWLEGEKRGGAHPAGASDA